MLDTLDTDVCMRALDARDARFDGVFFVGITTTKVYCRPVCPARVAYPDHRRIFDSAATAERAGFRPCLRCRPELAPGRALCDAVSRLAGAAAHRIAAGALNGHDVSHLAMELGVSERHLRRAMEREMGVSPVELAQTHRLLLAKRLLADTTLSVTRIAFASGFQSLRRFNSVFRERYRMSPSALRGSPRVSDASRSAPRESSREARAHRSTPAHPTNDLLRLTLAYRPPMAWDVLVALLRHEATPGVEVVLGRRFARTVRLEGRTGVIVAENADIETVGTRRTPKTHLNVDVSPSLLPALMPLLARLRQLFDLDAEPTVVDDYLARGGLDELVRLRPGVRIPGALDGFEVALIALLRGSAQSRAAVTDLTTRVVHALGEPLETGIPTLTRVMPSARRVAEAGVSWLAALGVPPRRADAIVAIAHAVADGMLQLEPGRDPVTTIRQLTEIAGVSVRRATTIAMRTLNWPDAFPDSDRALQRAAGVSGRTALRHLAEQWRPWRGYAAIHLWMKESGR